VTVEDTAEDVWPDFETLAEGDEAEIESYLGELAAQPEGQAFSPSIATIRRRKRLLSPSLRAFVLDTDAFVPLSSASGQRLPAEPVDIVLTRAYIAEMPERSFEMQIAIGADHNFSRHQKCRAAHSLVMDGHTGDDLPITNLPVLRGLRVEPGAELNIRMVFLEGKASSAALDLLKSAPFRAGIELTKAFNPIFGCATHYLESLTKLLIQRGRNKVIANARFGIYDYGGPISSLIGVGDYLFVQLPQDSAGPLSWDRQQQRVLLNSEPLDANYLLLRVAEHQD
jgi:hypothetical protein